MRHHLAITLAAIVTIMGCPIGAARAQSKLPCDEFVKNPDGSWSALHSVTIHGAGEGVTIRDGSVLRPGAGFRGLDIAEALDRECPVTPEPEQSATLTPPPRVALGTFADVNGDVDARKLTCGAVVDVSPDQAERLLVWYSGRYSGSGKKREFNLVRVGNAVHAVLEYCKSNRDKKLAQVLELMLK